MNTAAKVLCVALVSSVVLIAQYSVEDRETPPHRIDEKYKGKLEFLGTNYDMEVNIADAEADWWDEMEANFRALYARLPEKRRKQLQASQSAWEVAMEKDRDFFFDDPSELRFTLGREGEILSKMEFMNRVKKRALDLAEYISIFVEGDVDTRAEPPMVFFPKPKH